ncbi:MAG TPA: hypothetical protein PKE03_02200 [Bacteroidales bacterium]|nr:hypothetical protein [Bacteroidales bacterium]
MRSFVIALVVIIFYIMQLLLQDKAMRHVDGDGSGYYAYLTAVFIHKGSDFSPVLETEKKRHSLDYMAHYFHPVNGVLINKFYMGTALMILPFFLLAMLFSWISGMPVDGYNIIFQYAVALSGATWLAIGLLVTIRLLLLFDIPKSIAVITLIAIAFGTNLFHYAFLQPSHSHVYSFAAIAIFLLYSRLYFKGLQSAHFLLAAAFYGLVILIRPSNGILILALPFVAGSKPELIKGLRSIGEKPRLLVHGMLLTFAVIALQLVYNFHLTGSLFLWSYQNEGFNFASPAFMQFLFSFRKGFFVYTPIMLFMLAGLMLIWQESKWMASSFLIFFLVLVYILSSWWNWFYGDSFGMRPMVDFYALFAIPFSYSIRFVFQKKLLKFVFIPVLILLMALNLFQTWQYKAGIIHPDAMNAEKYRHVFLRWDDAYKNVFGGNPEPIYSDNLGETIAHFINTMEHSRNPWTSNGIQPSEEAYSGNQLAQMNQSNIYSPTLVLQQDDFVPTPGDVYVKVNLQYRENEPDAAQDALLVYAVSDQSQQVNFYKTFRIKQMPDSITDTWRVFQTGFRVPPWDETASEIKVYIWNKERKRFQLDDFEVQFFNIDEK